MFKYATISPMRATNEQDMAGIIQELTRQRETRRDFIKKASDIKAVVENDEVMLSFAESDLVPPVIYEPTLRAHELMQWRLDISKQYYHKMGESAPDLLAHNINYWLEREPKKFFVRTLDDKVRALMSDRFRSLDSVELFFTALSTIQEIGAKIVQLDLTENRFYIKMLHPEWAVKVENFRTDVWQRRTNRPGGSLYHVLDHLEEDGSQWLVPGAVFSNSDVGYGSLHGELFCFDTICWNGLVHNRTLHQVHLGRQQQEEGLFISNETRELEDRAVWSKVKDMLIAGFDKDKFLELVQKLQGAAEERLEDSSAAIDTVVKNWSLSEEDKQNLLNEFLSAGSNTVYGLITAVTAVARDKTNQDEAIRLERAGGDILDNPREFVRVRRERRAARAS